jgi:hypothetical protein
MVAHVTAKKRPPWAKSNPILPAAEWRQNTSVRAGTQTHVAFGDTDGTTFGTRNSPIILNLPVTKADEEDGNANYR